MPAYLMSLEELTSTHFPFFEGVDTWEQELAEMRQVPSHWATVERLVTELHREGRFREPIGLTPAGRDEDGDGYDYPTVSFGYHRTLAHYITGISPVLVQDAAEYYAEAERDLGEQYQFFLETDLLLDLEALRAGYGEGEDYTDVIGESYSFPSQVVPGGWYTPITGSSREQEQVMRMTLSWEFNQPLYDADPESLNQEIADNLRQMLPVGSLLEVTTYHEAYDDESLSESL